MTSARNCLYNSGYGKYARCVWNNDMSILWHHVSDIFYEDRECCLYILSKLSNEHIKLTYYSKINVRPAAQVLSSVNKVLLAYGPLEQKLQKHHAFVY